MTTPTMTIAHVDEVAALSIDNLMLTANAAVAEVLRQDTLARTGKFGGTHILPSGPDHARLAVLMEEVGEVSRELNEALSRGHTDKDHLVTELIQVAACAIAWATALESGLGS
jgi:hypothetical protein